LDLPLVAQTLDYTCGAACFDSMYRYFKNISPGEMHFAKELGALELGYTPPKNIVKLAKEYGFACELSERAQITDLVEPLAKGHAVFVTWWDEDAGHYSLVQSLDHNFITLMDPWTAREGAVNRLAIADFIPHWHQRGGLLITVADTPAPSTSYME
jgi:predicted double-glycine peptidase